MLQHSQQIEDRLGLPPHDIVAEKHVLGAMLQDKEAAAMAIEMIESNEYFYSSDHQEIFNSAKAVFDIYQNLDVLLVGEELTRRKKFDEIGGNYYLTELIALTPSTENIQHHIDIIEEKYILRQIAVAAAQAHVDAHDLVDCHDLLDRTQRRFLEIGTKRSKGSIIHIGIVMQREIERIEKCRQDGRNSLGIMTGFKVLDEMLNGFQDADSIILAGRPSMGKTSFALNCVKHIAICNNIPIGFISLEMSKESLNQRLISDVASIDTQTVRRYGYTKDEMIRLSEASIRIGNAPLFVDDTSSLSDTELKIRARRMVVQMGARVIFVDYLQKMRSTRQYNSKVSEVGVISQALKNVAKDLHVPVVSLSQLSRSVEQRGEGAEPRLSDLRESGDLEQDADVVIFIHRPGFYEHDQSDTQKAKIIIDKQRNGPTGSFELIWQPRFTRFVNIEIKRQEDKINGRGLFVDNRSGRESDWTSESPF